MESDRLYCLGNLKVQNFIFALRGRISQEIKLLLGPGNPLRDTLERSAKSKSLTFWEIRPPMCNFKKRIVYSRNDIEFSHSVVEFPRRLDFCVDHTFHGWHIAAGLDSHSKSLTFWEIRSLQLEETIFNVHTR